MYLILNIYKYQNNFVYNAVSVYEQHQFYYPFESSYYSEYNLWDNCKEGNYWSNYIGSDNKGDGIGDSPHIVYENKTDNFPLINPVDIEVIPENNLTLFGFLLLGIILLVIKLAFKKAKWKIHLSIENE